MKGQLKLIVNNEKLFLSIVFITSFLIRLIYVIYQYHHGVVNTFSDDIAYKHYGEEILKQGIFVTNLEQLGSYSGAVGPGIGWILSLIFLFFGGNWLPVFIVNSIVSAGISILIYYIAKLYVNKNVAIASAIYSVAYIFFIKFTATAGKEIWMTFLMASSVLLLIKTSKSDKINLLILFFSFVFAFFIHLDERYLLYSPLFFAILLLTGPNPKMLRFRKAILFSLLVVVFMIPWTIRNYTVYNRIILVSVRTNPFTEKLLNYEQKKYFDDNYKAKWYISQARMDSILQGKAFTYDSGDKISPEQIDAMRKGYLPHDFSETEKLEARFIRLWQPFIGPHGMYFQDGWRYIFWSKKHNISILLTFSWLLLFLPFGLYAMFKKYKPAFYIYISIFALHTLIHVFFIPFTDDRYRVPIDSFIIIAAFTGILFLSSKLWPINEKIA